MSRWQGRWLLWIWLLLPGTVLGQEPLLIPRAAGASDIASASEPLKLARPASTAARRSTGTADTSRSKAGNWTTTGASLIFVLSLIAAAAYWFGRHGRRLSGMLPDDVLRVLGRRYLDQRISVQLVRCGSKILILANSSQHGLTTLSEITDPHEVELITGRCLPTSPGTGRAAREKIRTDAASPFASPVISRSPSVPNEAGGNRG